MDEELDASIDWAKVRGNVVRGVKHTWGETEKVDATQGSPRKQDANGRKWGSNVHNQPDKTIEVGKMLVR